MPELPLLSSTADLHPYASRFGALAALPANGRSAVELLRELAEIADAEDTSWLTGKCSGTMYSGDVAHYSLLNEAFALFSHMNALQRDMCPSATRFESEIVAIALDLMHGEVASPDASPCGIVTSGGTESILSAMLVYREQARERGIATPKIVKPETAHPAFVKAAHLLGMGVIEVPVDPHTAEVDVAAIADRIDPDTAVVVGSAGNYPYGTVDPIAGLSSLALKHGVGLHVDACLGGFILPWGEELGYGVPIFDFRLPGVTSISIDTHKFGYGLKGASVALFRQHEMRRRLYFLAPDWSGGAYASPGIAGSRSVGLLAAAWAALVSLGREGFRRYAEEIFATSFAMQRAVVCHPELRLLGQPTFCFAFTADAFNILRLNDRLRARGWRFNGLQHPSAIHMCVTRPQTRPGVVEEFERDLAHAVQEVKSEQRDATSMRSFYGRGAGVTEETSDLRESTVRYLDRILDLPPPIVP